MVSSTDFISKFLGNKSRFKILNAIASKPLSVNEIAEVTKIEQTNVSHNLKYMKKYKLVTQRTIGKKHIYSLRKSVSSPIKKLLKVVKKQEEMLKKGGIIAACAIVIAKVVFTGNVSVLLYELPRHKELIEFALRSPQSYQYTSAIDLSSKIERTNILDAFRQYVSNVNKGPTL